MSSDTFPFRRVLSLEPLAAYWRALAEGEDPIAAERARPVLERWDATPALHGDLDVGALEPHRALVEALMAPIFPDAFRATTIGAALTPFGLEPAYETPAFAELGMAEHVRKQPTLFGPDVDQLRVLSAYHLILHRHYGVPNDFRVPFTVRLRDDASGVERSFRLRLRTAFCAVEPVGVLPALSPEAVEGLLAHRTDLERWTRVLPPDQFVLRGLTVFEAVETTDQEIEAEIAAELLGSGALGTPEDADRLAMWFRALFRHPDLKMGLIALPRGVRSLRRALPMGRMLAARPDHAGPLDLTGTAHARAAVADRPVILSDLADHDDVPEGVRARGVGCLYVAALRTSGRLVGLLELGASRPGVLHALNTLRLDPLRPLLATAIRRTLDERENELQAVIKSQYTSLHPAVEWRFREAAEAFAARGFRGSPEPIVFKDVYALYGLADIRGSSDHRNAAIQADLTEQLELARSVIEAAREEHALPILDELDFRLAEQLEALKEGLASGDEVRILELLHTEIEDAFEQLATFGPGPRTAVQAYRDALDPTLGVLYKERKAYEESVEHLNDSIGAYIDREEQKAQEMVPHYFEKYKTDGVDYNIYAGASLVQDGQFSELHLHNLRLWQLMMACGVVWEAARVRAEMAVPLEVASLILAQSQPFAIRFRTDEKKFDVDGAYNVRYEIVKKRIDKAEIAGTGERLTQPGRIAIVYAQDREADEYLRYLEYLEAQGYTTGEVEELDLEDMQGVRGLHALRVRVAEAPPSDASPSEAAQRPRLLRTRKEQAEGAAPRDAESRERSSEPAAPAGDGLPSEPSVEPS